MIKSTFECSKKNEKSSAPKEGCFLNTTLSFPNKFIAFSFTISTTKLSLTSGA